MARDYGFGTLTEEQGINSLIGLGVYTEEETKGKSFNELYRKYEAGLKDPDAYGRLSQQIAGTRGAGAKRYGYNTMTHTNSNDTIYVDAGDIRESDWDSRARESRYRVFSSMKKLYDSTGGNLAGSDSEDDGGSGEGEDGIDIEGLMRLQEEAALRAATYNRNLAQELTGDVRGQTVETAQALDEALQREMDRMYPGLRTSTMSASQEALEATRKAAAEFSTGMVPQDVQDYQKRLAASLGISRGVFGTAPNYALAQNLGLNSLEMKKYGTQLYAGIPSMSAQILANARTSMPAMNQLPQMYDSMYARQFAASAMPTGAFMGSIAGAMGQNANLAQDQAQFDASLSWARELSAINQAAEAERNRIQWEMFKQGLAAQKQSNWMGLAGKLLGGGLGMMGGGTKTTDKTPQTGTTGTSGYGSNDYRGYYMDWSGGEMGRQYYDYYGSGSGYGGGYGYGGYGNYFDSYGGGYGGYGGYEGSTYGFDSGFDTTGSSGSFGGSGGFAVA